jgi:chemotaxis protein methyltransferase CheR
VHVSDRQDIELALFQQALKLRHGYDFSGYAPASFKRRVLNLQAAVGAESVSRLTERLIHDDAFIREVIERLSVPVSEMFRDPRTFRHLREDVMPWLSTYPAVNVWQAGCAHGEEVYSLAIILKECGLYERAHVFATDFSDAALLRAEEGIYPLREARLFSDNYLKSGGTGSLSDWYTARYRHIKLDESLKARITFANHNLAADGVFGEMQLILCRNVLIYFNDDLQERVLGLFRDSLARGGFLCLGNRETLARTGVEDDFVQLMPDLPLYRRVRRDAAG